MTTLAKLVVKLITDVSEFEAGMQNAAKKMDKVGQSMTSIGDKMTLGVTVPLVAAGAASVKFASDLNESLNKSNVVFGESAKQVEAWSKTTANSLGLSQNAALDATGKFGSLFVTMGMGKDKASQMSMDMVKLAADLGSFYNISNDEALDKLRSGLVGEAEPLRTVGVLINEAAVKAKAMEMGLGDSTGALTEQEKVLARYAIIMDQTKIAQGDFANTSTGLANTMKRLGAMIEDTAAKFGAVLIPTLITFMNALIPVLDFFNQLPGPVKQGIVYVLLFAAALGPVIGFIGRLVSAGSAIAGLFGTGGALAGAGTWITATLLPALAGIGTTIGGLLPALAAIALPVVALIAAFALLIFTIKTFGAQAWQTVQTIGKIFEALPKLIASKMGDIGPVIANALRNAAIYVISRAGDFVAAGQNLMVGLINGIVSYATYVVQVVMRVVQNVIDAVKRMLGIHSPSSVFAGYGENMMKGLEKGVQEFSSRPIAATVNATSDTATAAAGAIRPSGNGGRSVSVGPITINGDLSTSQKERLKAELQSMFVQVLGEALNG